MNQTGFEIGTVFQIGPLGITSTIVTTWFILLVLGVLFATMSRLLADPPGSAQTAIEALVSAIENAVAEVAPQQVKLLTPFIGSLWVFLVVSNLIGLVPGLHSPTRDISATSALAIIVFLSVHWYGVRAQGLKAYLSHYLQPSPILLPFHIVSEITRTVALAVRLFGNIMSLEMAALLVLLVAGFLAPVPILMLHIIEALVQAYIFGMLALVYVAGGIQSQQIKQDKLKE